MSLLLAATHLAGETRDSATTPGSSAPAVSFPALTGDFGSARQAEAPFTGASVEEGFWDVADRDRKTPPPLALTTR